MTLMPMKPMKPMTGTKRIATPSSRALYSVYQPCRLCSPGFVDEACYAYYLLRLKYRHANYGVMVHAFCLLPDRLYLLATASSASNISRLLASVNESYSAYFCSRFQRNGMVWAAQPTLMPVRGEQLGLELQVLIERSAMEEFGMGHPGLYPWSSYCSNAFGASGGWLTRLRALDNLAPSAASGAEYRNLVARRFEAVREQRLLQHLHGGLSSCL